MAKMVFETMFRSEATGSLTAPADGNSGTWGKFARAIPTILVVERPARICTQWVSIRLMEMSRSGRGVMESASLRADMVQAAAVVILAVQLARRCWERAGGG